MSAASSSLIESWSATARMQIEAARLQKSEGKEAEGSNSINECSYEKAYRTARLQKAECRSRRQEAAVSASMRKQIEAARLQTAEGRTVTVSAASSRLIESLQAARGKR